MFPQNSVTFLSPENTFKVSRRSKTKLRVEPCLSYGFYCYNGSTVTKRQVGEERVYFTDTYTSESVIEEVRVEPQARTLEEELSRSHERTLIGLASSSWLPQPAFLTLSRTTGPGWHHSRLDPLINQQSITTHWTTGNLDETISQLRLLSPDNSSLC